MLVILDNDEKIFAPIGTSYIEQIYLERTNIIPTDSEQDRFQKTNKNASLKQKKKRAEDQAELWTMEGIGACRVDAEKVI